MLLSQQKQTFYYFNTQQNAVEKYALQVGKEKRKSILIIAFAFGKQTTSYHYTIFLPYVNHKPIDITLPTINPLPALANDFPTK